MGVNTHTHTEALAGLQLHTRPVLHLLALQPEPWARHQTPRRGTRPGAATQGRLQPAPSRGHLTPRHWPSALARPQGQLLVAAGPVRFSRSLPPRAVPGRPSALADRGHPEPQPPRPREPAPSGAGPTGWARARPLAGAQHVRDVGEEVVVLCLGHGRPQLPGLQELGHQDAEAVLVRELGCEDLEDGLGREQSGRWGSCARQALPGAALPHTGPGPGCAGDQCSGRRDMIGGQGAGRDSGPLDRTQAGAVSAAVGT